MKFLIIVTLVCFIVSNLQSTHPRAILPQSQMSVEETVAELVTHHLAKRQADPSSLALDVLLDCAATELDFQCGPSGYAQQSVDVT